MSDYHTEVSAAGYNDECSCRALTQNSPKEWNQRNGMSASSYDSSTVPTCNAACDVSGTLFGYHAAEQSCSEGDILCHRMAAFHNEFACKHIDCAGTRWQVNAGLPPLIFLRLACTIAVLGMQTLPYWSGQS